MSVERDRLNLRLGFIVERIDPRPNVIVTGDSFSDHVTGEWWAWDREHGYRSNSTRPPPGIEWPAVWQIVDERSETP